jgi:hypothetical protein
MCLITVKCSGAKLPKDEHLVEGEKSNSDGIGCCYWKKGSNTVVIKKDFVTVHQFITWMHTNINIEDVLIVHFRWATSGLKDAGNRHPFPITKDWTLLREANLNCQFAVAHNGVFTEYSNHVKYSDTQKFIVDILGDEAIKNNLENQTVRKLIASYISTDRLAILNSEGTVYMFGDFETEEDIFYSNTSYKIAINRFGAGWWNKDKDKDKNDNMSSLDVCEGCGEKHWISYFDEFIIEEYQNVDGFFCKKCRKNLRKGKIPRLVVLEKDNFYEGMCLGCNKTTSIKYMTDFGGSYCKSCLKERYEKIKKDRKDTDDDDDENTTKNNSKTKETVQLKCAGCLNFVDENKIEKYLGEDMCDECRKAIEVSHQDM